MTWVAVILLAIISLVLAVFVLRLPKSGATLLASVLIFGLAGYAMQGAPAQPSAPKAAAGQVAESGEVIVAARRALFDPDQPPPGFLTVSDGFARRGRYEEAATLLRNGLAENPDFGEGWLALAIALVEHADGRVTPAALEAFSRAESAMEGNPGAPYFLGVAYLRSSEPAKAREVWQDLLENSPADAPWRADLEGRLAELDRVLSAPSQAPAR